MKIFRSPAVKALTLLVCALLAVSVAVHFAAPAQAATDLTLSASKVSDGAFTVTIAFPAVNWGGFQLNVSYPDGTLSAGTATITSSQSSVMMMPGAASGGKIPLTGMNTNPGINLSSAKTSISIPFTVKDAEATEAKITVSVVSFVDNANKGLLSSSSYSVTVTLKASTSTSSTTDTTTTDTKTDTSTDKTSSTKTDTATTATAGDGAKMGEATDGRLQLQPIHIVVRATALE